MVVTAWFTAAENRPRVLAAVADGGAEDLGAPVLIDGGAGDEASLGRVDVRWISPTEAEVTWLGGSGDTAVIRARRVHRGGAAGPVVDLVEAERSQASGSPRIAVSGHDLLLAFTDPGPPSRVRGERLFLSAIPEAEEGEKGGVRVAAASEAAGGGEPTGLQPGAAMPALEVQDLRGETRKLAPRGRATLINVWATWCAPCVEEMPVLDELQHAHADGGLHVVGVSVDDASRDREVRKMVDELGVDYAIRRDPDNTMSRRLGASALAMNLLFDESGRLVWWREGILEADDAELSAALSELLDG